MHYFFLSLLFVLLSSPLAHATVQLCNRYSSAQDQACTLQADCPDADAGDAGTGDCETVAGSTLLICNRWSTAAGLTCAGIGDCPDDPATTGGTTACGVPMRTTTNFAFPIYGFRHPGPPGAQNYVYQHRAFAEAVDTQLALKENAANKNATNGYAGLSSGKVAIGQLQEVTGLADLSDVTAKKGNSTTVQMQTGATATDDCAKFDATGNLVSAGGACGIGGAGAVSSVFSRNGAVISAAGDYTAGQVTNAPAGAVAGDTVQEAIDELDTEKLATASQHAGTNVTADLEEEAHAGEHQNGGADEIATATPGANAIPKAGGGGTLGDGWLPSTFTRDAELDSFSEWRTFTNVTGTPDGTKFVRDDGTLAVPPGGSSSNSFATQNAPAGTDPVADSATDTLNWVATAPATITGDSGTDTLTVAVSDASTTAKGAVELATDGETASGVAVQGNDARLSDARTPTAHATSHQNGGADEVATATPTANSIPKAGAGSTIDNGWLASTITRDAELDTFSELVTFANITGTCDNTTFVRGDGACSVPTGGGDFSSNTATSVDSEVVLFSSTGGKTGKRATGTGIGRLTSGVLSSAELSGDVVTSGSNAATIQANSVALTTDTTGNYVVDVAGTANEVTVSHTPGEGSTATLSLPTGIAATKIGGGGVSTAEFDFLATITSNVQTQIDAKAPTANPVFTSSLQLPNGATPTVDAFGEIAGDNNFWGTSRGAPLFYDGTSVVGLVGILASDTCTNGQGPVWNTGGTWTCETPAGSGDVTTVGDCMTGDCFTGASGTTLKSNTDIIVDLDDDNNGTESFQVRNGADAIVFEVSEAGQVTAGASATPTLEFKDSDATDGDVNASIGANCVDVTSGSEDCTATFQQQVAGTTTTFLSSIAAGVLTLGNSATTGITITSPFVALGSDPADAGAIRLDNAANIAWEAAPAGTDCLLGTNASEVLASSCPMSASTFTGALVGNADTATTATTATTANAGDSATAFFSAGQIEAARGGTGDDTSATTGMPRIDAGNWTYAELSGDVVTSGSNAAVIQDNSVDGTDIAIASQAAGDIAYYDGTDWVRLPKGTAGQVLEMNAGATAPEWDADDGGGSGLTDLGGQTGATQTITRGVGIGGTSATDDHSFTLDLAELVNNQTIFDASQASRTITFGLSGATDPILTAGDGVLNLSTGSLQQGGTAVSLTGHTHGAATLDTDSVSADELNATGVEAELETVLDLDALQGAVTDAQVPNTVTIDLATVATTANAGDSATAFFSAGTIEAARLPSGSTTASGIAEATINTEVDTGTDAARYVTPDSLAGSSIFGRKTAQVVLFDFTTAVSTGDGKYFLPVPTQMVGMNIVAVSAHVITVSSSGAVTVDIARCAAVATGNTCSGTVVDLLSTNLTIDANESKSATAAAAVIDAANDDLAVDQVLRFDVDGAGTGTQGLIVTIEAQLP